MRAIPFPNKFRNLSFSASALACALAAPSAAQATVFVLTATDVVVEEPAPLFTSATVTGTLTLDNAILPGQSFGSASITGLVLNLGGIVGTLADIKADVAPGDVQGFGTRSLDGNSFSVFDLRFGFPATVAGCGFVCAGRIIINSSIGPSDPSNFIAIDDTEGLTTSVISSFTPRFARVAVVVPEPASWTMLVAGFGLIGWSLRQARARTILAHI